MVKFPLKEIQSTRTQRPTASSSYPYVELTLGDVAAQCAMQLQLEQVGPSLAPSLVTQPVSPLFRSPASSLGLAPRRVSSWPRPREHPAPCRGQN